MKKIAAVTLVLASLFALSPGAATSANAGGFDAVQICGKLTVKADKLFLTTMSSWGAAPFTILVKSRRLHVPAGDPPLDMTWKEEADAAKLLVTQNDPVEVRGCVSGPWLPSVEDDKTMTFTAETVTAWKVQQQ